MTLNNQYLLFFAALYLAILAYSCKPTRATVTSSISTIDPLKLSGGSSGMTQLGEQSYLVVYDIKIHKRGPRMAMIQLTDEAIEVASIQITGWGEEGRGSDLESICKVSGRTNEYLIAESGNWKGNLGRIFHLKVDTASLSAKVIGITKLPFKNINNKKVTGDQYESIVCLPYNENERILLLGERGGSPMNPRGIVRWGKYNLVDHTLKLTKEGMQGITVNAPGDNYTDLATKRDLTDLHVDEKGGIWAAASEDVGDTGPFYSVIYKLGNLDASNPEQPFYIFDSFARWQAIPGFKIEALSGPSKHINSTLSFGTEDEIYGGVWRAVVIDDQ